MAIGYEFIGYVPVPLSEFGVYESPESRLVQVYPRHADGC